MTALDLIARLEGLDGPSREVDAEIWKAANPELFNQIWWDIRGSLNRNRTPTQKDETCLARMQVRAPHYTASIDCALTALPDRWRHNYDIRYRNGPDGVARVEFYVPSYQIDARARTVPIAISIIALKARL